MLQSKAQDKANSIAIEKRLKELGEVITSIGNILNKSNIKLAEKRCLNSLKKYPDNQALYYFLGVIYFYNNKLTKAKDCFDKVIYLGEYYLWARIGAEVYLGLINAKLGMLPEAEQYLLNAVELDPCWVTHWHLAEFYNYKMEKGNDYGHYKLMKDKKIKYITTKEYDINYLRKSLKEITLYHYEATLKCYEAKKKICYIFVESNTNENIDLYCHLSRLNIDLAKTHLKVLLT